MQFNDLLECPLHLSEPHSNGARFCVVRKSLNSVALHCHCRKNNITGECAMMQQSLYNYFYAIQQSS